MMMDSDDENMWPEIVPPVITAPVNGATGILIAVLLAIGLGPYRSGYEAHVSTSYQIEDTSNGAIVWQSNLNVSALLAINVPSLTLALGKTYRIRARFHSATYVSEWSDAITIST